MHNTQHAFLVLIEWDGGKAPSRYYRRLHALALRVRGDKEQSPLARRSADDATGVIFQEGAVVCPSESLARTIAFLAADEGAVNVSIGRAVLDAELVRSRQDAAILTRIESICSRRGPKPPDSPWAVTCTECVRVSPAVTWSPINCPNCGGLLIHARRGGLQVFADPGGDVVEAWQRTRWAGPHWEPVEIDPAGLTPPAEVVMDGREAETVALLESSAVLGRIRQMPRGVAFGVLDAIMVARAYRSTESRLQTRLEVATEFFRRGGSPAAFRLTEPPEPDLVDAAGALGAAEVVTWLLQA